MLERSVETCIIAGVVHINSYNAEKGIYVHAFRRSFSAKVSLKIKRVSTIIRSLFVSFFPHFSLLLYCTALFAPCAIVFSLFLPLPLSLSLSAFLPHSRSFLSLFKLFRELARCVHVHALSSLPNGNSLL